MRTLLAIVAAFVLACGPLPPPKPIPSGDIYQDACDNLARLGEPEGSAPDCADLMQRIDADGLGSVEAPCLAKAETRTQLEACYADDIE